MIEALLARFEAVRAGGGVALGLAGTAAQATAERPHTPKLCLIAPPQTYRVAGGKQVQAEELDVIARMISMGKLHHAIPGTGAVAVAVAAALPGTLVHTLTGDLDGRQVRIGHTAGTVAVGARAREVGGVWQVEKASMSRSARRLMEGWVRVPEE